MYHRQENQLRQTQIHRRNNIRLLVPSSAGANPGIIKILSTENKTDILLILEPNKTAIAIT